MEAMKIDVSEAEVDLIVGALEYYFAHPRATARRRRLTRQIIKP